ncbi:MAG: hypothetical protein E7570_04405 [Ruminococcaceae bacterium]|nr:hypothetical protein [Oscillospiraceae bacterium]
MSFNAESAMADYIKDETMSYRRLAKKYSVSYSTIAKAAKQGEWIKKRKQGEIRKKLESSDNNDKLCILKKTADTAIEMLYGKLWEGEPSINDLKNISSVLKTLTAVQRDLNYLPTFKEENTIRISNERLKLVRTGVKCDEEESETGIVLIPWLDEEEEEE